MRSLRPAVIALCLCGCLLAAWLALPFLTERAKATIRDRLQAESGLAWTIDSVGLGLDAGPELVLRDLRGRWPGTRREVRIAEVRLPGLYNLVFGNGDAGHAIVRGIAGQFPITADGGATAPNGGSDPRTITSLHGRVRGLGFDPNLTDRIVRLRADDAEIDYALGAASDSSTVELNCEAADSAIVLKVIRPAAAGPAAMTVGIQPRSADGLNLTAQAQASGDAAHLKLDAIQGTIDNQPFFGTAGLDLSGRPNLSADLHLARLIVADDDRVAEERGKNDGLVLASSTLLKLDPKWLDLLDGNARVEIADLTVGPVATKDVKAATTLTDGVLDLTLDVGSLYGGAVRVRYVLAPKEGTTRLHQLSLSLTRMRLSSVLGDLIGVRGLDGVATGRIDVQASGTELGDVLRSAGGRAQLSAVDGWINGFDLARITAHGPTDDPSDGGGGAFATKFSQLSADFDLGGGLAKTNNLVLRTSLADVAGAGSVDYLDRTLDLHLDPSLAGSGSLAIPIHVMGPWDGARVSADFSDIAAHPEKAIQSLQGLLGKGGALSGGGLGDLLQGLVPRGRRTIPSGGEPNEQ